MNEFAQWAFGKDIEDLGHGEIYALWNMRHGDKFTIKPTDKMYKSVIQMAEAYIEYMLSKNKTEQFINIYKEGIKAAAENNSQFISEPGEAIVPSINNDCWIPHYFNSDIPGQSRQECEKCNQKPPLI